ncbi:MAG: helix-turn-helix transcriptional regulator [Rhizomicrobium sp.]
MLEALPSSQDSSVGVNDMRFYEALGARIAEARKAQNMTQVQLAEELGIAQQTLAHYEVGRVRVAAALVPRLAHVLAVSVEDLLGDASRPSRRGPAPKLLQQIERIQRLPRSRQRFIMQMIDTALQANTTADAAE